MTGLDVLRSRCNLDLDEFNLTAAEQYDFEDMSEDDQFRLMAASNQALLLAGIRANPGVLSAVVARAETFDLSILDSLAIALALPILPHLKGRVHFQLSPTLDTVAELVAHGRRIISLAVDAGIPQSRISLKIPITPAGMLAAKELGKEVACLGTMCFTVAQGMAAAQAGCVYVAPYFSELSVHFEGGWIDYKDKHPMLPVVGEIVETYKRGNIGTRVMAASVVTGEEALRLVAAGVQDMTIPVKVVKELEGMIGDQLGVGFSGEMREWPDLLAGDGEGLAAALKDDADATRRLEYAFRTFARCEQEAMDLVEAEWRAQGKEPR